MYYLFDNNWNLLSQNVGHNPLAQQAYKVWDHPTIKDQAYNWIHQIFDKEGKRLGMIAYLPDEPEPLRG